MLRIRFFFPFFLHIHFFHVRTFVVFPFSLAQDAPVLFFPFSIDNDRPTVETPSFSVDIYRKNFKEILAYNILIFVSKNAHHANRKISVEIILFTVHFKNSWDKMSAFCSDSAGKQKIRKRPQRPSIVATIVP